MRTVTTAEYDAALAAQNAVFMRLDVTDPDGAWRDMGALGLAGTNFFNGASLSGDLDDLTLSFAAELLRDQGPTESLSPFMEDSILNRDAGDNYAPLLDLARFWRLRLCVKETPEAPLVGEYRELATGVLDDLTMPQGPTIAAAGRGMEGILLDIEIAPKKYGSDASPVPMETVIQEMIDDTLGPGVFTLYTPVSPLFVMDEWKQQPMSLMEAISIVADRDGFIVRFKYDASDVLRLTLFEPDRSGTTPVFTLGPNQYQPIARAGISIKGVRNLVPVEYQDRTLGRRTIQYPASGTSASITRYRKRTLPITLAPETQVVTEAKAISFATKVCSDLEFPFLEQQIVVKGVWFLEVYDFGTLLPNGKHYSVAQGAGITGFTLAYVDGKLTFTFDAKARPAGRYKTWLDMATQPLPAPVAPDVAVISVTQVAALAADVVVAGTSPSEMVGLQASWVPGIPWLMVVADGNPTPAFVASGTNIGPTAWFWDYGTTYLQVLNDRPLDPVLPTNISVRAYGQTSGLTSPWLAIPLPGGETTGEQGGGATPTGVSVNVIIPVLVTDPADSPTVVVADDNTAFSKFRYNPAPFTQIRLDAEVLAAGDVGGVAQLEAFIGAAWNPVPGANVPIDVAGLIPGTPTVNPITTEEWFRVVPSGAASLKSLWVTFMPRSLSVPPAAWVPPALGCITSLSGLEDFGEDWCPYPDEAALRTAYNWAEYLIGAGPGTFWSDYDQPDEDVEGRDIGLYDNIAVPLAPDYRRMHMVRGLPFNGGSAAVDFDSDVIFAETGATIPNIGIWNYRGMRNSVPVSQYPGAFTQPKVTLVSRIWIDAASDLDTSGNWIEPCYVGWASFGAFGECYCVIGRFAPFTNTDAGSPRLWLVVYSFNGANAYVYDCGSAAPLIGYDPGHEFKLEAEVLPPTSSAFDKMQARLSVRRLPGGGAGGMEGQWIIRNQNLLNLGSGFWDQTNGWFQSRRNAAGRVHARCYSIEQWFGDKIWLGEPALLDTQDVAPIPNDTTVVTATAEDEFNPATRRTGVVVPLDSAWVKYNDGGIITSANKDGTGNAALVLAADGSGTPRGVELVLPNADGAWDLDVVAAAASQANSGAHIWLRESGTGKWAAFGLHNNGTNRRWSLWNNSGELYRSGSDLAFTAFRISVERFAGTWYFYRYTPGFNTETSQTVASLFTVRADRIGFGGWSGASGITITANYLRKTA